MSELLDAIIHLCDTLLTPSSAENPRAKPWVKVIISLIALAGMAALIALFVLSLL